MHTVFKVTLVGLSILSMTSWGQEQSNSPADKATSQNISRALIAVGIDPRTTSVNVITTADHVVYLTGLIADRTKIKLAGDTAAKAAPSYRITNNIRASFFDDPNHVTADKTK